MIYMDRKVKVIKVDSVISEDIVITHQQRNFALSNILAISLVKNNNVKRIYSVRSIGVMFF